MKKIIEFLEKNGWIQKKCIECNSLFFSKKTNLSKKCGWRECESDMSSFKKIPKPSKKKDIYQLHGLIREIMTANNINEVGPLNIKSYNGKTDLIGAGVQIINPILFEKRPYTNDAVFIAQPSVRTQYLNKISGLEGVSTSFINIATVSIGSTLESHLEKLDLWMESISKVGLYMGHMNLILRNKENLDWGTGKFSSIEIFFNYAGLEIGDASFFEINTEYNGIISISDIGFGLERILWAHSKTDSYLTSLVPISSHSHGDDDLKDLIRTAVLFKINLVPLENKGAGLYLKKIYKKIIKKKAYNLNFNDINYYYKFWSYFIENKESPFTVLIKIQKDLDLIIAQSVREKYNLPQIDKSENLDGYLDRLFLKNQINLEQIKALF